MNFFSWKFSPLCVYLFFLNINGFWIIGKFNFSFQLNLLNTRSKHDTSRGTYLFEIEFPQITIRNKVLSNLPSIGCSFLLFHIIYTDVAVFKFNWVTFEFKNVTISDKSVPLLITIYVNYDIFWSWYRATSDKG